MSIVEKIVLHSGESQEREREREVILNLLKIYLPRY